MGVGLGVGFFWWAERGATTFLMSWKGVVRFVFFLFFCFFFLFFHFQIRFSLPLTTFVPNNLVEVLSNFLTKLGNEIAYLMPTEYKIFLGKGALPSYNPRQRASPLDPCEHIAHRMSFPQFIMEWRPCIGVRKGGGAAPIFDDSRGEKSNPGNLKLVEAWNLWWKWYKLRNH